MYLTNETLHQPCTTALNYENLRKWFIKRGEFKKALATYFAQTEFLPDKNSSEFWDKKFDDNPIHHPMESWRIRNIVNLVEQDKSLLNLGVGSGRFEKVLFKKKNLKEYTGTDITNRTLTNLKTKFGNFRFKKEILTRLSFSSNSFDQVLLLEVLEHIKPNETFFVLKEIKRVLVTGGTFIVSVPINEGLEAMLPYNPNSHMRIYSKELLAFELNVSGFLIEKVIEASAFSKYFEIKNFVNKIFNLRKPNNIIFICKKK